MTKPDDLFIELLSEDLDITEQYFPEFTNRVRERISNWDPFIRSVLIKKLPEFFPKWKANADQHLTTKREKLIKSYIDIIDGFLCGGAKDEEIRETFDLVKDELSEQLEYWKTQLNTDVSKWTELFNDLVEPLTGTKHGYVSGDPDTFNHVMEHKQLLPGNNEKIKWHTAAAYWKYFADEFGFELSQFKKCFEHFEGKKFHTNNTNKRPPDGRFRKIIKNFSDQKADHLKA